MKWLKRLILLLAALIAVLVIMPFFVSLDQYRPGIEQMLAEKLKEPVRLKNLRLAGLPLPHVVVDGIEIGKADIKTGRIAITPDLWSLLTADKVIRSVSITGLVINQRGLDRIPAWIRTNSKAKSAGFAIRVQTMLLDGVLLQSQKASFGPFDARVTLTALGVPERADINTRDGKLRVTLKPDGKNFSLDVQARDWQPPAGPPILFDELLIKGSATLNDANLADIKARLYGGTVIGWTTMDWRKGLQLRGNFSVKAIELRNLVPLFSPETRLSGRLTAKPVFSANAQKPEQIGAMLRLDTPFDIQDGVLHGIDIQKAATNLISRDSSGQTRFDVLSGNFALDRATRRITNLKVVSGSLSGDGHVTIAPNKDLSGRINVQIGTGSVSAATIPLNVSGNLDAPRLLPTAASVAGAAAGTAILGPVGTSVGAKVGNWAENLFGGGEKKK